MLRDFECVEVPVEVLKVLRALRVLRELSKCLVQSEWPSVFRGYGGC